MSELHALVTGFYTVPEAARLIRVGSARRIYGWLRGYPSRHIGPLLSRDYQPIGDEEEVSFLDLMEIRFVMFFREKGVKIASLRKASDSLRKEFSTKHPFALSKVLLKAETVIITGDKNIARRPHQIHAFCACDLICFFCDRHWSQQDLAYQCAHLIRWWPTVQDTLQTAKPKDCWWLPMGLRGELKKVQLPNINEIARKSKTI